jgi:hypothetical protein
MTSTHYITVVFPLTKSLDAGAVGIIEFGHCLKGDDVARAFNQLTNRRRFEATSIRRFASSVGGISLSGMLRRTGSS